MPSIQHSRNRKHTRAHQRKHESGKQVSDKHKSHKHSGKHRSRKHHSRNLESEDPVFLACYEHLKARVDGKSFTSSDVIIFAVQGMQIVERYPGLSGPEKKQLVVSLAKRIVNDLGKIDEGERAAILLAIDMLLPSMIDQVVAASRGQLDLNKIGQRCFAFLSGCKPKASEASAESQN